MAELETWARGTVEVLPCPFCGTGPEWRHQGNEHTKSRRLVIRCPECRVERANAAIRNDFAWLERITVEQWNRRSAGTQGKAASVLEAEQTFPRMVSSPIPPEEEVALIEQGVRAAIAQFGSERFARALAAPEAGGHAAAPSDELRQAAQGLVGWWDDPHDEHEAFIVANLKTWIDRLRAALSTPSPTPQQSSVHQAAPGGSVHRDSKTQPGSAHLAVSTSGRTSVQAADSSAAAPGAGGEG